MNSQISLATRIRRATILLEGIKERYFPYCFCTCDLIYIMKGYSFSEFLEFRGKIQGKKLIIFGQTEKFKKPKTGYGRRDPIQRTDIVPLEIHFNDSRTEVAFSKTVSPEIKNRILGLFEKTGVLPPPE